MADQERPERLRDLATAYRKLALEPGRSDAERIQLLKMAQQHDWAAHKELIENAISAGEDCPECGARPGNAHRIAFCIAIAAGCRWDATEDQWSRADGTPLPSFTAYSALCAPGH